MGSCFIDKETGWEICAREGFGFSTSLSLFGVHPNFHSEGGANNFGFGRMVFWSRWGLVPTPADCTVSRHTTSAYLEADHHGIFWPCTAVYLDRWGCKVPPDAFIFSEASIPFVINHVTPISDDDPNSTCAFMFQEQAKRR